MSFMICLAGIVRFISFLNKLKKQKILRRLKIEIVGPVGACEGPAGGLWGICGGLWGACGGQWGPVGACGGPVLLLRQKLIFGVQFCKNYDFWPKLRRLKIRLGGPVRVCSGL